MIDVSIASDTPVEVYNINGRSVHVKREDTCCGPPGPPFSKIRGLWLHMQRLQSEGVDTVGYVETSISMAGWGVAWCARSLGMRAVIYDPQYKEPPEMLLEHRARWDEMGAVRVPIKPNMLRICFNVGKRLFRDTYGAKAIMLELGLPLPETVEENARIWRETMKVVKPSTTVLCIGSGTICAGLLRGWRPGEGTFVGVLISSKGIARKVGFIESKACRSTGGFFGPTLTVVDPGWEYRQPSLVDHGFLSHRNYDLKAWQWLKENLYTLQDPVLFWNIGRELDESEMSHKVGRRNHEGKPE